MATSLILSSLLILLVTLLLAPPTSADENNILLTGDVLATNGQLSYLSATFVMQNDCNLVLYNGKGGFASGTNGNIYTNCTLTLDDYGQLAIYSSLISSPVWTSPLSATTKKGNYAAVLGPDGQVNVYGPAVWSTPPRNAGTSDDGNNGAEMANIPMVRNVLFSSQVLYNNAQLATRDYTFVMRGDCNLVLNKASGGVGIVWQSGTSGKGKNCFARLGHQGQLAVEDDRYKTLWSSKPVGKQEGDYVLVLQINGQAVVYGPSVWSTA